ncbi:hypothetical protein JDN40_07695 [Rhodomicrobium vannielii ATCC 17100]|uniref:hypothetical protein n=1 Tax=Rhodomicrobium vannielii TaxID=1069 RepID=UPI00191A4EC4|nr:hypothetical protein [Rhodomicrobium vannielii]MBJ7533982.1 hypothetical protein [Rhodomicrobium vannielii ATCC 17100]
MTDDDSENQRLSKFSRADRGAYGFGGPSAAKPDPLAEALEQVIRGRAQPADRIETHVPDEPPPPPRPAPQAIHSRLIEELHSAREQIRQAPSNESAPPQILEGEILPPPGSLSPAVPNAVDVKPEPGDSFLVRAKENVRRLRISAAERLHGSTRVAGHLAASGRRAATDTGAALSRRMRLKDWRRRRLALLCLVHRHVFDRHTERLLFSKTPPLEVYAVSEGEKGIEKEFVYRGPMPKKVLDWTLSVLPRDLKRHAFLDFRAGNGRTLLLAARRNFEYAAGYAFDTEGCEVLEMNLAQYPRSWLDCRDVRALRGDRDGLLIPAQPSVLFFPDALPTGHIDIILSYVSASLHLDPREIWLIFENAGREKGREQMELFDTVPLPFASELKTRLFSPVPVAVYRSKADNEEDAL